MNQEKTLPFRLLPRQLLRQVPFSGDAWLFIGLFLFTVGLYAQTVNFGFLAYDDPLYVTKNPRVLAGLSWDTIRWSFTTSETGNWAPLVWLSYAAEVSLLGPSPALMHLNNALLHALNGALLFLLLRDLTGKTWPAALAAAVFALHPLRVESVAWISERKDVLSCFFLLLTLRAYVQAVRRPTVLRQFMVLLMFALALMSKAMVVTLPVALVLVDHWPLGRTSERGGGLRQWLRLLLEKWPLFVLSLAIGILTILLQHGKGAVSSLEDLPLMARLLNVPVSYLQYLGRTFWPDNLAPFYPFPPSGPDWRLALAAVLLLGSVTLAALWQVKRRPYLLTGWFWFVITLLPVIGLLQVGAQAHADRYSYIPSMGLSVLLAWGTFEVAGSSPGLRRLATAGWSLALVGLALLTHRQVGFWRDDFALFNQAIRVTRNNYLAHAALGSAYRARGMYPEAVEAYRACLGIAPQFPLYHFMLGDCLELAGRREEALACFVKMLELNPNHGLAELRIANLLSDLGRREQSIPYYLKAIGKDLGKFLPDWEFARGAGREAAFESRINLGYTLRELGRLEEAVYWFDQAFRLEPGSWKARVNLGMTLSRLGRHAPALAILESARSLAPGQFHVHAELAAALHRAGRFDEARVCYRRALEINPAAEAARTGLASLP